MARRPITWRFVSRVERPEAVVLAIVLAGVAAVGWYGSAFWLAVSVAGQLAIGGLGAVWIIGPATARLGFARYATLAASGVSVALFGRVAVELAGVLLVPGAAALLWGVLRLELELERTGRGRWVLDLVMVAVVYAAAYGAMALVPPDGWLGGLALVLAIAAFPALRMSEARARYGAQAIGEALLHILAVAQVGAGVALLALPDVVAAAVIALAFHAWAGAAEALEGGSSARSVALEFGALAILGLVVAFLVHGA